MSVDVAKPHGPISGAFHFIKTSIIWLLTLLWTIICGGSATVISIFVRVPGLVHYIAYAWGFMLMRFSLSTYKIEGKDKYYKDGPVIIVSNHQSMFDIPLIYCAQGFNQFRWLAKASLFKIPFMGWGMSGAGYVPVERGSKEKSQKSLFEAAKRVTEGNTILVFPEGTRSKLPDAEMLPFKKGGFIIAKKAKVHIQPLTIWGSRNVIPMQPWYKMQRVYGSKLKAIYHDPIPPEEYENLTADELADKLRAIIEQPFNDLRAELPILDGKKKDKAKGKNKSGGQSATA